MSYSGLTLRDTSIAKWVLLLFLAFHEHFSPSSKLSQAKKLLDKHCKIDVNDEWQPVDASWAGILALAILKRLLG